MTPRAGASTVMTIGALSRRTGVSVKVLREYEDLGLIYTVGRSAGNYRLFGQEALWCAGVIGTLRGLGLTVAEIRDLAGSYLQSPDEPADRILPAGATSDEHRRAPRHPQEPAEAAVLARGRRRMAGTITGWRPSDSSASEVWGRAAWAGIGIQNGRRWRRRTGGPDGHDRGSRGPG
jgi:DNA-binding transcriptional MerR regulator